MMTSYLTGTGTVIKEYNSKLEGGLAATGTGLETKSYIV